MITVFTTTTCAYCKMVKQFLSIKGKEYEVVNLDESPERKQELFERTGVQTVPVTQIGDNYIIGWNRSQLAEAI